MLQPQPFGKYVLLDRISVGGMAEVFCAKRHGVQGFEKIIAIKRILPQMGEDSEFIKMFVDEAKIAGQLSHANICQIFELGEFDGSHFIAMEHIWGKDLLQLSNRFNRLERTIPPEAACYIMSKVCEGLDYAHRKRDALGAPLQIIHRDCSPQNVLVSFEGEVKIIDFGIAKAAVRLSRTNAGVLKGKFGYMSPEQVRGLPVDRRTDIFAVGTVLHELLTGQRLFVGASEFSTLEKVRKAEFEPPMNINPEVPEAVNTIVEKALARNPDERYQWCSDMRADLQAYLTSREHPYTDKNLAELLADVFGNEKRKERTRMEELRRMEVSLSDDALESALEGPTAVEPDLEEAFDQMETSLNNDADDDRPQETIGEVSAAASSHEPDLADVAPNQTIALDADFDEVAEMIDRAEASKGSAADASNVSVGSAGQGHSTGDEMTPPAISSYSAAQLSQPIPVQATVRPNLWRDIAIGVGIAVTMLGAFAAAKMFIFTDELLPQGTLYIVSQDGKGADISVDGNAVGTVSGDGLQINNVAAGSHVVVGRRDGVGECIEQVEVNADKITVVRCAFSATESDYGFLMLDGVEDEHRIFLDKKEISLEAAREDIKLAAGTDHVVHVQVGDVRVQTMKVRVDSGERVKREVKAAEP